jgi:uncharacterized protein (DUF58 family)
VIAPSSRLLFWTAAALAPAAALAALFPDGARLPLLLAAFFLALTAGDALVSRRRLAAVTLHCEPLVRLARFVPCQIPLQLALPPSAPRNLRLALALPPEFTSPHDEIHVSLPAQGDRFQTQWPCTARRRGSYRLRYAAVECASRLGFWMIRRRLTAETEVRVYPDLRSERKRVAASFLHRGMLGEHGFRQVGKGREFEQMREYLPGDSFEDICWKATARRQAPVTKMYRIERTQEVYVLLDAARLGGRPLADESVPGNERTLLDGAIMSALMLGEAAYRQGDRFGMVLFSDRVERFFPAAQGKAHLDACREALAALDVRPVSPDYAELFCRISARVRKRALLVVLTWLDDPLLAEQYTEAVQQVCRRHVVITAMVRPPRARPVFSGPAPADADEIYLRLGGHWLWRNLHETALRLRRRGVRLALPEAGGLSEALIARYLDAKRRQWL